MKYCVLVVIACSLLVAQTASQDELEPAEYEVYGAVIDAFVAEKRASHPMVHDSTLTFSCTTSCSGFMVGGCNGLRSSEETPKQRLAVTRRDIPELKAETIAQFSGRNNRCSKISGSIATSTQYVLWGSEHNQPPPAEWKTPDSFLFSRVGFDRDHTQALVVVGFVSATDASKSAGNYYVLQKTDGRWKLGKSSAVWSLSSD